jgi:hypothetical protein
VSDGHESESGRAHHSWTRRAHLQHLAARWRARAARQPAAFDASDTREVGDRGELNQPSIERRLSQEHCARGFARHQAGKCPSRLLVDLWVGRGRSQSAPGDADHSLVGRKAGQRVADRAFLRDGGIAAHTDEQRRGRGDAQADEQYRRPAMSDMRGGQTYRCANPSATRPPTTRPWRCVGLWIHLHRFAQPALAARRRGTRHTFVVR